MGKTKKAKKILFVQILEAKPNELFSEEQRRAVRFLRYSKAVACAECGKKRKLMWTMLCQFRAVKMDSIVATESQISHSPLTPVCSDHPIGPDWK